MIILHNNSMQWSALRAAADAERYAVAPKSLEFQKCSAPDRPLLQTIYLGSVATSRDYIIRNTAFGLIIASLRI